MALPALAALGARIAAWTGGTALLSRFGPRVVGRVRPALSRVSGRVRGALDSITSRFLGGAAAGGTVGFGLGGIAERFGVESDKMQLLAVAAVVIGAIIALGQLFNVQVDA